MDRNQIALQMWTLRDVMDRGAQVVYEAVARMGYAGVEIGDTGDMSPERFRAMIEGMGLAFVGRHTGMSALEDDLQRTIDTQLALGGGYLTVAYLEEARRPDAAGYRVTSRKLAEFAAALAPHGIPLLYHNHAFEFQSFGGVTGYDLLFDPATSGDLAAELDVYWAKHGGHDPVAMIDRMAGRSPILHMKDMAPGEDREFCEVGEGIIDMPGVVAAGDRAGVEWYVVEQDVCKRDPLESVGISYRNLARLAAG